MPWKNLLLQGFLVIEYVVENCSKICFVNITIMFILRA